MKWYKNKIKVQEIWSLGQDFKAVTEMSASSFKAAEMERDWLFSLFIDAHEMFTKSVSNLSVLQVYTLWYLL